MWPGPQTAARILPPWTCPTQKLVQVSCPATELASTHWAPTARWVFQLVALRFCGSGGSYLPGLGLWLWVSLCTEPGVSFVGTGALTCAGQVCSVTLGPLWLQLSCFNTWHLNCFSLTHYGHLELLRPDLSSLTLVTSRILLC
jgi:hypothetical protein